MQIFLRLVALFLFTFAIASSGAAGSASAATSYGASSQHRSHYGYNRHGSHGKYGHYGYRSHGYSSGSFGLYFGNSSRRYCGSRYRSSRYGCGLPYYGSRKSSYSVTINPGSRGPDVSKTSPATQPSPLPPAWATGEGAWPLLAAGQLRPAAARFAVAALERPGESDARVGYALAKAAGGDLAEAAWALRRAFLDGNDVATLSSEHPEIVNLARDLIVRYDAASPSSTAQRLDFDFAPVALAYLAGDARAAAKSAAMLEPDCLAEGTVVNLRRLAQIELTAATASEGD